MGRKRADDSGDGGKPLLKFDPPVSRSKVAVNIKDQLKEYLRQYPAFVEATQGAKVTEDEVAERIFERFFQSDRVFLAWVETQNGDGAGSGARAGAARTSAAASAPPAGGK